MKDQFDEQGVVLENALAFWVHRVYQASRNVMFQQFHQTAGEEITPEQWVVLVRCGAQEGQTQSELGAASYRDRPTMSRILSGMEKRGLVRRSADASDSRIWRIHLTPKGKALRTKLLPAVRKLVRQMEHGLSETDLEVTRRTLRGLFENLDALR